MSLNKSAASTVMLENMSDNENLCVVCYRNVEIYSIGECDHPVCYECSTRMRVLCETKECPICRKLILKAIFTKSVQPYNSISIKGMKSERKYSIFFENDGIMNAYDNLLEHRCPFCETPPFSKFNLLKEHVRKAHEKFYCELCVLNLKIFTRERRCYNRAQLGLHRRKGDVDDTSHRGHPLCKFCDQRFVDNDELFRHLRRDHFYCHFCDADGVHQFYEDYNALREHFSSDHFLCEEGDCLNEKFTSVFRTKLDLQGHVAQQHSHNLSRQAARQARTVDIQFTLNHRPDYDRGRGRGGRGARFGGQRRGRENEDLSGRPPSPQMVQSAHPPPQHSIDINCVQDFPSLNGVGPGPGGGGGGHSSKSIAHKLAQQNRLTIRTSTGHRNLHEEEFPSLGSTTSVTVSTASSSPDSAASPTTSVHLHVNSKKNNGGKFEDKRGNANVSIKYNHMMPASSSSSGAHNEQGIEKEAATSHNPMSHTSNIVLKSNNNNKSKVKSLEDDFPALQMSSSSLNHGSSGWVSSGQSAAVTGVRNSQKPKDNSSSQSSVASCRNFSQKVDDFPSLMANSNSQQHMKNYHGRSSLTIPVSNAWTHTVDHVPVPSEAGQNQSSKNKKKKKNAAKGDNFNNNTNKIPNGNAKNTKKKTPGLSNIFDDSDDEDSPQHDYSAGKLGEYQSAAPSIKSNVNLIDANTLNQRKKSELNIGTLKYPSPTFDREGDFPSLSSNGKVPTVNQSWRSQADKKNNRNNFTSNNTNNKKKGHQPSNPPPGFQATNMTFTSSSGEKFAISPTAEDSITTFDSDQASSLPINKTAPFSPPQDFETRNKNLIQTINNECAGNLTKFEKFKELAQRLRNGGLHGRDYYSQCSDVMGRSTFHRILPELLGLLPDIKKQQEVLEAYRLIDGGRGCSRQFAECCVCYQVLTENDFNSHMELHDLVEAEFPSLACISSVMLK